LEAAGILTCYKESKALRVLVANEAALDMLLKPVNAGSGM